MSFRILYDYSNNENIPFNLIEKKIGFSSNNPHNFFKNFVREKKPYRAALYSKKLSDTIRFYYSSEHETLKDFLGGSFKFFEGNLFTTIEKYDYKQKRMVIVKKVKLFKEVEKFVDSKGSNNLEHKILYDRVFEDQKNFSSWNKLSVNKYNFKNKIIQKCCNQEVEVLLYCLENI